MIHDDQYLHIHIDGKLDENEALLLKENAAVISSSNSLVGGTSITDILIVLSSPIVLKSIKEIVLGIVASKRRVTLKTKDIEVTDIDEKTAMEIIERISMHQQK